MNDLMNRIQCNLPEFSKGQRLIARYITEHYDKAAFMTCLLYTSGRNSALAKQGIPTQMRSLDSVLGGAPCTMLKLDVEGAEHQALLGAQQTIKTHHPRLNVACYHRNEDCLLYTSRCV